MKIMNFNTSAMPHEILYAQSCCLILQRNNMAQSYFTEISNKVSTPKSRTKNKIYFCDRNK